MMRPGVGVLGACVFVIGGAGGCVDRAPDEGSEVGVKSIARDLTLGSTGPDVAALNRFFRTYGYLPNEDLQRSYPAWRPIVPVLPERNDVFDAQTEQAARAFQINSGLPVSGVVDAATRELLRHDRCGVPDGIEASDPDNKWDLSGTGTWGKNNLVWRLTNAVDVNGDGATNATDTNLIESAIASAVSQWASVSAYTFTKWTSGAPLDIQIQFLPLAAGTLASTAPISGGGDIIMSSARIWSTTNPVRPGATDDVHTLVLHELGHAIGLAHTSITTPAMPKAPSMIGNFGNREIRRDLQVDDKVAALAMNLAWQAFDSRQIVDVAYNIHTGGSSIYVVGATIGLGGYEIWELINQTTWFRMPSRATRIAVGGTDRPWAVNSAGSILRWNFAGSWDQVPGCAVDVGVGSDDSVWIIGCNDVTGGKSIWKFKGTFPCVSDVACWTNVAGGAARISVGPRKPGEANVPWIIQNSGAILRGKVAGGWEPLPGSASDIAASSGYAWSIGTIALPNAQHTIQVWNEQPDGGGSPPARARSVWRTVPGAALSITAAGGIPIVANQFGAYWPL